MGTFGTDELVLLKKHGFDVVELNFNHRFNGLDWRNARMGRALREEAKRLSVRLLAHGPEDVPIAVADEAQLSEGIRYHAEMLRALGSYGAESLVIHAEGYHQEAPGHEQALNHALRRALCELVKVCEETNVPLFVETMTPGRATSRMDAVIDLVDAVGSQHVGICLDTNHTNLSEDPAHALLKGGDRIREIHVSDNHGEREEHLPPYSGIIDWEALTRAIAHMGYDGAVIMEANFGADRDSDEVLAEPRNIADRLLRNIQTGCSQHGSGP